MNRLERALHRICEDLSQIGVDWALIGGLAVGVRGEPRTTIDVNVVVAVQDDAAAERLAHELSKAGLTQVRTLESEISARIALVRWVRDDIVLDVMMCWTGIEPELVMAAETIEVASGITAPVITTGHLIAMKVLSGRLKDRADVLTLRKHATPADLLAARSALELVLERGFTRGVPVIESFEELLSMPLDRF